MTNEELSKKLIDTTEELNSLLAISKEKGVLVNTSLGTIKGSIIATTSGNLIQLKLNNISIKKTLFSTADKP